MIHEIKVLSETQRLIQGRHGAFVYNPNDTYIGKALELYGEYCEHEVQLFAQFVKPGMCVWDVGANIGALTVPLAKLVGETGQVCSFEPQPVIFNNLCTNVSINGLHQVRCLPFALASETGRLKIPALNYNSTGNFGAVSLSQQQAMESHQVVEMRSLADLDYLPLPSFMKIDVEGMETQVLKGLASFITKQPPIIYLENDRIELSKELIETLWSFGYSCYWHITPYYNSDNYRNATHNAWPNVSSFNMLCVHESHTQIKLEGEKITDSSKHPLER